MVWVYVRSLSLSFSVCMSVYFVNASGLLAVLSWRTKKCLGSILSPLSICIKVNYIIKIHVYCCMCACDFFFTCASFFSRCNLFFLSLDFFFSLSIFFVCRSFGYYVFGPNTSMFCVAWCRRSIWLRCRFCLFSLFLLELFLHRRIWVQ